jgi:hypothetical protein
VRARQAAVPLVVVNLILCLVLVPVAAAAAGWQTFNDSRYGIRVSIPSTWQTVPPSVAGIKTEIAKLEKQNQAGLATVYATLIANAAARKQTLSYYFQALRYESASAVQPDFALSVAKTTAPIAADKKTLAASFAHSYAAKYPGTKISKQAVVDVPAGQAALVEGTQPVNGTSTRFEVYVLSKGTLIFVLSFRAAPYDAAADAAFAGIVEHFAFS